MDIDQLNVPDHLAVVGDETTDGERAEKLSTGIMNLLKENLSSGPLGPGRVYECLNALAVNAAILIAGSGEAPELGELFKASLNANLDIYYKTLIASVKANEESDQPGPTIH